MMLSFALFSGFSILFVILQGTVLEIVHVQNTGPDISFIILCFHAFQYGIMPGQIHGFLQGIAFDIMSLSPPGFNMLVRTLCGFFIGSIKGIMQLDVILLPMALVGISFIGKTIITLVLSLFIPGSAVFALTFSLTWFLEFIYTILVTPIIFAILRFIQLLLANRRSYR